MDFLPEEISKYAEKYSMAEPTLLKTLSRETYLKKQLPQMLAGNLQGQFISMISKMIQPKIILEIGTFTGYSAICLARGLQKGGILHTIEIDKELEEMATGFFRKAKLANSIKLHIGEAIDIIPTIKGRIDLAYIDADKPNYSNYFELILPKMRKGGFIIADNVLWSGKVLENRKDKETRGIKAFNNKIVKDDRVENTLLPIRDGLMIMRKK